MREGALFLSFSHQPTLLFEMAMNLINFPQVESVLLVMVIGKPSPCLYLNPGAFHPIPHSVEKRE